MLGCAAEARSITASEANCRPSITVVKDLAAAPPFNAHSDPSGALAAKFAVRTEFAGSISPKRKSWSDWAISGAANFCQVRSGKIQPIQAD